MSDFKDITIPEMIPELERGPQWLKEKRHTSRTDYNNTPIPPRGLHLWRYTDPAKFVFDRDNAADTAFGENYDKVEKIELENLQQNHIAALVTDKGGREFDFHGTDKLAEQGIIVCTLSEAVKKNETLVNEHLYNQVNSRLGKFEAMNGALWNDGLFIYVPDGKVVDKPIHLLRESGLADSIQFPRLLVIVGKNAELTLIDEYGGGSMDMADGQSYTNGAVELVGLNDSRTRYISLQRQTSGAVNYLSHRASIGQNASMLTIPLTFGGMLSKQNFGVSLNGQGADSKMYGLLFGTERQHFDNHTMHHHTIGNTTSDIDFKVVLKDRANSAYTGLIKIDKNAKTCEAYQENRNLMLNKGCNAETIPELEILNEDVMCSHGATIGPLDPEMVFYLKGRGIHYDQAVRMIVSGFVEDTIKIVPEDLKERIRNFINQRLEHI